MKSAKRKTIMIDGVRYYAERPRDCRKCFFWKNRKVGCTLGRENCYYLAEVIKTEQEKKCSASGKGQSTPDSDGKGQSTQTTAPKTGAEANVTQWVVLMLAAVCAAGGLGIFAVRKGRRRR